MTGEKKMTDNHEIETTRILDGITTEHQLLKGLKEYCFLQGNFISADLFGVLFFESNPLIQPFFIWNTNSDELPILDTEKIPWRNEARFPDTVRIDKLKLKDPINQAIKNLTGSLLKSVVMVPLTIDEKPVGTLIVGNKSKKPVLTEGAAFHAEIASLQVTEVIKKTAGFEAWDRARLLTSNILNYRINALPTINKNPAIIVELLQIAFNLRGLLLIRAAKTGGYMYYYAEIDEAGKITGSETGPHRVSDFTSLRERKNVDDSFIEFPIIKKQNPIGVIYLRYAHQDNVFKDAVKGIVQRSALRLSEYLI